MSKRYDILPNPPNITTDILQHCQWRKIGENWYEIAYKGRIFAEFFRVKSVYWYGLLYDSNRVFRAVSMRLVQLVIVGSVLNRGN